MDIAHLKSKVTVAGYLEEVVALRRQIIDSKTGRDAVKALKIAEERDMLAQVLFSKFDGKDLMAEVGTRPDIAKVVMGEISKLNDMSFSEKPTHLTAQSARDPLLGAASGSSRSRYQTLREQEETYTPPRRSVAGVVAKKLGFGKNDGYKRL